MGPEAVVLCAPLPPQPELGQSQGHTSARDSKDICRGKLSYRPSAEPRENVTTVLLMAVPDSVSVWRQVKQTVVASRDFEGADKINVLVSGAWKPGDGVVEAHPVLRGSRTMPDKYTPFQWPVLSEL